MDSFFMGLEYWATVLILFVTFASGAMLCLFGTLSLTVRCMAGMLVRILRGVGIYTLVCQYGLERLRHRQHPLHLNCVTTEGGLTGVYLAGKKFAVTTISPLSLASDYAGYKVTKASVNEEWFDKQGREFPVYYTRVRLNDPT